MTARGSRVIEQSAELAAGQAPAPGVLTRFFGEAEQSAYIAAGPSVNGDANHEHPVQR